MRNKKANMDNYIQFIEMDSNFIDKVSHWIHIGDKNWYFMPYWFEKIEEGLYRQYKFEDLPSEVKNMIELFRNELNIPNEL